MSIKIYEAYRFPLGKLNEFIAHVRPKMLESFYARVDRLMQIGVSIDDLAKIDEEIASWEHPADAPLESQTLATLDEIARKVSRCFNQLGEESL